MTLYNNAPWDAFVDKAVTPRLADNRLPNVTRLVATPESLLEQDAAQYDAAIFISRNARHLLCGPRHRLGRDR